ncbi:class I SAM-dependent methyltransferase [Candidatus Mycoplasma pogonae]
MKYSKKIYNYFENDDVVKKYGVAVDQIGLWKSEMAIFSKYFSKQGRLLDLGCGSGRTTFGLYDLGYRNLIGVDLSHNMIQQAQNIALDKNVAIEFFQGDATQLQFEDASFDNCLFSFNGFNAIPTEMLRRQALHEIHRILKSGGIYIFTSHNRNQNSFRHHWEAEAKRWAEKTQNPAFEKFGDHLIEDEFGKFNYIHFYAIEELHDLLIDHGFEILEIIDREKNYLENAAVLKFSNNTIFYVVRKK